MLKRVIKITSQPGETKYEKDFQIKFGDKINNAMNHLETCVDLKNPTRLMIFVCTKIYFLKLFSMLNHHSQAVIISIVSTYFIAIDNIQFFN